MGVVGAGKMQLGPALLLVFSTFYVSVGLLKKIPIHLLPKQPWKLVLGRVAGGEAPPLRLADLGGETLGRPGCQETFSASSLGTAISIMPCFICGVKTALGLPWCLSGKESAC